jgi:hypothetical protein
MAQHIPFWVVVLFWLFVAALFLRYCYESPIEPVYNE